MQKIYFQYILTLVIDKYANFDIISHAIQTFNNILS